MKAIVTQGAKNFIVKDMPKPELRSGCLLIRPLTVSLCLTEKRQYMGIMPSPMDFVLGHECCGVVEEVAPDVEGFAVGDRVAPMAGGKCGECLPCKSGMLNCDKGFWDAGFLAEYSVKPAFSCYKLPDEVSDFAGAVIEPYSGGTRALRHSGVKIGDNVVVLGIQDYTWALLQWLKPMGVNQIIAVDPFEKRRELALKLGADVVLDPTSCDVVAEVKKRMPFGADVSFVSYEEYIEPSKQYLNYATMMGRIQGTIINLMHFGEVPLMGAMAWTNELTIKYLMGFGDEPVLGGHDRSDYAVTIDAMAKKKLLVDPYITKVFDFKDINTTEDVSNMFEAMVDEHLKVLIRVSER